MLKFVKKKTGAATTPPPPAVEISRPSNLIVSKHRLVRTDGDFILIMEDEKVIGLLDKRDLELAVVPTFDAPSRRISTTSTPPTTSSSPQSQAYLIPTSSSSNRSAVGEVDVVPLLSSPIGISPNKYKTLPAGAFSSKQQQQQQPWLQWQFSQNHDFNEPISNYKSTSVEQLFSPPIPTPRNRSESTLQAQGSHKYDTITFAQPNVSSSAQCNVEIRLGDDRTPPPPPNRAPPVPLCYTPCLSAVFVPADNLDYTQVQSVSVEDPDLAEMTLDEMRKHAEDIESYIQGQVQEKWCQEKAQTEKWIENIAGRVAKAETMNTIKLEMSSRKRPSLSHAFDQFKESCPSLAPSDPDPNNGYERLYYSSRDVSRNVSRNVSPVRRQFSAESDGDIEDIRF
ncbi:hypothetical protein GCK72_016489 [Caenorhabditis remanei]|uniref:Uncharacterized protein n=1 Tax=Caenorhabditis remanei TaxID=31234 RepID=A0A6A5G5S4_CAERE|nr:hypothetical protein GCK72_016489 [Caenorhabditis remanei]KAF1749944.1 hypothetical protein GCK72_016489 [Caenorhabditis remanei]